jgi:hypothetical protein
VTAWVLSAAVMVCVSGCRTAALMAQVAELETSAEATDAKIGAMLEAVDAASGSKKAAAMAALLPGLVRHQQVRLALAARQARGMGCPCPEEAGPPAEGAASLPDRRNVGCETPDDEEPWKPPFHSK